MTNTTCTCVPSNDLEDGSSIGCPVHDFGFRSTADRIEELTGMRALPNVALAGSIIPDEIDRLRHGAPQGVVHQGAATLVPIRQKVEFRPAGAPLRIGPVDFLASAILLIPDQPTPEQWTTIKIALAELLDSARGTAGG